MRVSEARFLPPRSPLKAFEDASITQALAPQRCYSKPCCTLVLICLGNACDGAVFISEVASPGTQHFPITGEAGDDACMHATLFICQCRVINGLAHFCPHDTTAKTHWCSFLGFLVVTAGGGHVWCDCISLLFVCLFSLKWPQQPHRQWPLFSTKHTTQMHLFSESALCVFLFSPLVQTLTGKAQFDSNMFFFFQTFRNKPCKTH